MMQFSACKSHLVADFHRDLTSMSAHEIHTPPPTVMWDIAGGREGAVVGLSRKTDLQDFAHMRIGYKS
jgi:hypothetical protein